MVRLLSNHMGKNSNKNNSPERKVQWKAVQKLSRTSSKFIKVTSSDKYLPEIKEPSKRDLHRMQSGYAKYN